MQLARADVLCLQDILPALFSAGTVAPKTSLMAVTTAATSGDANKKVLEVS